MSRRSLEKHLPCQWWLAVVAGGLAALPSCKRAPEEAAVPLPFQDDFDRQELGASWHPSGGHWILRDGQVFTNGANNAPLFLNVDLPSDLVVEIDVLSETPTVDSKIELMTDGRAHQSGYIFILGGWSNQISAIARLDEHGADRVEKKPTGVSGKRWYRWRIEKKGGELSWYLDGQPYLHFSDPKPLDGPGHNRLAFSNWQNQLRYDRLRIYPFASAPPIGAATSSRSTP